LNGIFVRLAAFSTLWGCGDDPADHRFARDARDAVGKL